LPVREVHVKRLVIGFHGQGSILLAHDAEAALLPSCSEVVLTVGEPVWIDQAFIDQLLYKGEGIVIGGLTDVQAEVVLAHVPGSGHAECSEEGVEPTSETFLAWVDFQKGAEPVGVVLSIAIRVVEGEGAHDVQILLGGLGNFQTEPIQPVFADDHTLILDDGAGRGKAVGFAVVGGVGTASGGVHFGCSLGHERIHVVHVGDDSLFYQPEPRGSAYHEDIGKVVCSSGRLDFDVLVAFA